MVELINDKALPILYDLAATIGGELSVDNLLTKIVQRLLYHTGLPVGLFFTEVTPLGGAQVDGRLRVSIGDYALLKRRGERIALPGELLQGDNVQMLAPALLAQLGTRRPQSFLLRLQVPGHGVILLLGPRAPGSPLSLVDLFRPVMTRLATALTLCQSYEADVQRRVEQVAYFDSMTGLPNSILFVDTLRQVMDKNRRQAAGDNNERKQVVVAYADVDDFRLVNQQLGHEAGSRVLIALAQHFKRHLRPGEMVAHLLGDEFAFMLPGLPGRAEVERRIGELLTLREISLDLDGQRISLSTSLGLAIHPGDAEDADTLMRHAQTAMHQAKQDARGQFRLFDAAQDKRVHERRTLIQRLDAALHAGELCFYYQPKVDLLQGHTVGFEALIRWLDPVRGLVPPMEFLPEIEGSDFVIRLGEWGIREALRQAVQWHREGLTTCISVNIAARHLQLPDFVARVRQALAEVPGAEPRFLEIEVLESSTLDDFDHVRQVLDECGQLGVRFALDDFGTGYSSLAYLSQLPATVIKIDQMFVRKLFENREEPAIIRAIVQIADVFRRQVVAEGVETSEHGILLISMGCRIGQGYGIGRPMPAAQVRDWLQAYQPPAAWAAAERLQWQGALYDLFCARYWLGRWSEQLAQQLHGGRAADAKAAQAWENWLEEYLRHDSISPLAQRLAAARRTLHDLAVAADMAQLRRNQDENHHLGADRLAMQLATLAEASAEMCECIDALARYQATIAVST